MAPDARAAIEQLRRESGDPYAYVMASKWGPGGAKWIACWHVRAIVRSAIAEAEAGAALAGVEAIRRASPNQHAPPTLPPCSSSASPPATSTTTSPLTSPSEV